MYFVDVSGKLGLRVYTCTHTCGCERDWEIFMMTLYI